ncbi:MAG: hypothetical protein HGB26_03345 [Desulfobulbaceae bacterium]|nr:hypothetical protein [Desulfobulbaceae bacterium]
MQNLLLSLTCIGRKSTQEFREFRCRRSDFLSWVIEPWAKREAVPGDDGPKDEVVVIG